MPTYKTRHLEAIRDVELARDVFTAGQRFMATDADADYLLSKGNKSRVRSVAQPSADAPTAQAPVARPEPDPVEPAASVASPVVTTETVTPRRAYVRRNQTPDTSGK